MSKAIDKYAFFAQVNYEPLPQQRLYHDSAARFRVPVCGRRFGKSTMAGHDLEPKLFMPKKRYWIIGPTYDLGEKEFRVIWDDLIVRKQLGRDKRVRKAYNKRSGDMYIEFPWQTRLEVRSADHPENLVGEALDGAIMSEAAKHKRETWERFIRPALADKRGFADFPTTPEGFNWLHNLWQFGQNPDLPQYESWRFPSWFNSIVYPGGRDDPEIKLLELTTTGEWFQQEIGAEFSAFVGKIYSEWDETKHVIYDYVFHPEWPNYIAFDWGFTNPLAAVEFQVSPWEDIYVWREHYLDYTPLPRHVEMLKGRDQPDGYHLDLAFGDAADPDAAAYISQNFVPCMADPEAKANWRQGIDLVKKFLREYETGEYDEYGTPETKPKMFVDGRGCPNTVREYNNYRSTATVSTKTRESGQSGPTDRTVDDHCLDAIRYALMHLFQLGAQHHLAEVYSAADGGSSSGTNTFEPTTLAQSGTGIFTMGGQF